MGVHNVELWICPEGATFVGLSGPTEGMRMTSGLSEVDTQYYWKPHRTVPGRYWLAAHITSTSDTPSFNGAWIASEVFTVVVRPEPDMGM